METDKAGLLSTDLLSQNQPLGNTVRLKFSNNSQYSMFSKVNCTKVHCHKHILELRVLFYVLSFAPGHKELARKTVVCILEI